MDNRMIMTEHAGLTFMYRVGGISPPGEVLVLGSPLTRATSVKKPVGNMRTG